MLCRCSPINTADLVGWRSVGGRAWRLALELSDFRVAGDVLRPVIRPGPCYPRASAGGAPNCVRSCADGARTAAGFEVGRPPVTQPCFRRPGRWWADLSWRRTDGDSCSRPRPRPRPLPLHRRSPVVTSTDGPKSGAEPSSGDRLPTPSRAAWSRDFIQPQRGAPIRRAPLRHTLLKRFRSDLDLPQVCPACCGVGG